MSGAQVTRGVCVQCMAKLEIPDFARPEDDDVQICDGCFDPLDFEFIESHYPLASSVGVYPPGGEGGD